MNWYSFTISARKIATTISNLEESVMARTTIVSETHTVRDQGKGLSFNAAKIEMPSSGLSASITADRTDTSWEILNYDSRAQALKSIIFEAARSRKWRIFIPEISTKQVIIGFHQKTDVDEMIAFIAEIGFTQNPSPVKRTPTKRKRG